MSYPTLTARAADTVADRIHVHELDGLGSTCVSADGAAYPSGHIEAAADRAHSEWLEEEVRREQRGDSTDLPYLEAFMASRVHRDLRSLPMDMRQDFGFWRYLALFPYRWYLQLREPELKPQDYGGTRPKKGHPEIRENTGVAYQLMLRTFLWGKIAFEDGAAEPYRRTTLVNETGGAVTDIWHSHLVRIQLGQLGSMPHAFLDSVCSEPLANGVNHGHGVEKRLTRMKHTVLYDMYDLTGARRLVDEQKGHVVWPPPTDPPAAS